MTDDPTSPIEMVRWTDQTGHAVLAHRREGDLHQFLVAAGGRIRPRVRRRACPYGRLGRLGFSIGVRMRLPHSVHEPS